MKNRAKTYQCIGNFTFNTEKIIFNIVVNRGQDDNTPFHTTRGKLCPEDIRPVDNR